MKNQNSRLKIPRPNIVRRGLNLPVVIRTIVLVGMVIVGGTGVAQQAEAAQTATAYCNQYTSNALKNACKAGLNGEDCSDYAITFDQATADICTKAAKDKASGQVTSGDVAVTTSPSPTASVSPPSNSNFDLNSIQDVLDQTGSLTDYIDVLHEAGPDASVDTEEMADNSYGSYINGAGKKQAIKVIPSGKPNSPAILFFNGGGWHMNDGTSDAVSTGASTKNGLKDGRPTGAPDGGGATARGYTTFDVTYRLGSSGVYYMFEDVMRGIQHVRNNADMYGIDASKIAIWGDSAGGSLAMRAAASGKSGAKAAVGWSAPTNGYTAIFKSFSNLLIGMDHSTCVPTDLAGFANFTDLLNGGSGDGAEYGQGLSSNDFSSLGIGGGGGGGGGGIGLITEVLTAGQYAMKTGQNIESLSQQLESGGIQGMSGGVVNLSSKKLIECIDNFNVLSPALFASPETPPSFLAGFENDNMVDPQQAYDMRDKLRSLGIRSETMIIPGDADAAAPPIGPSENHLGYDSRFVCKTINFLDEIMRPDVGQVDCKTGIAENQGSNDVAAANGGGGGGGSGGGSESSSGGGGGGSGNSSSGNGGSGSGSNGGNNSNCGTTGSTAGCDTGSCGGLGSTAQCDSSGRPLPDNGKNKGSGSSGSSGTPIGAGSSAGQRQPVTGNSGTPIRDTPGSSGTIMRPVGIGSSAFSPK